MIKIAVCDDEKAFGENLRDIISTSLSRKQIDFEIDLFLSGKEFVDLRMDMTKYQIVFLDVNMDGMDGIETAKRLRELCEETYVVFVTAFIDYTLEGYKVDATRYVLKNVAGFEIAVEESLDAIFKKMDYSIHIQKFHFKEGVKKLNLEKIVYIESRLHEAFFHTMENELATYSLEETLNNIEKNINDGRFIRIHQSFLVNMDCIRRIKSQTAILLDDTILPISKPRYQHVRKMYADFKGAV